MNDHAQIQKIMGELCLCRWEFRTKPSIKGRVPNEAYRVAFMKVKALRWPVLARTQAQLAAVVSWICSAHTHMYNVGRC